MSSNIQSKQLDAYRGNGDDDESSQACTSTVSDASSFVVVSLNHPSRFSGVRKTTDDGDSTSAASSADWSLVGGLQKMSVQRNSSIHRSSSSNDNNNSSETPDSESVATSSEWSVLEEFPRSVNIADQDHRYKDCKEASIEKKRKHVEVFDHPSRKGFGETHSVSSDVSEVSGKSDFGENEWYTGVEKKRRENLATVGDGSYTYQRVDVLTRRLCDYLTECKWALNSVIDMRLLPERDLRGLVAKFLKAATCGMEEIPRIRLGYKVTESGSAAWDGIRWEGFWFGRKGSDNNGRVSVAVDLDAAFADYRNHESKRSLRKTPLNRLETIAEWDPALRSAYVPLHSNPCGHFQWMVATVEVLDPWGGVYTDIATRYVSVGGANGNINGLVRLFESRKNVLPLVCFDTHIQDLGVLEQIQEGLNSVLLTFFEQKPGKN